jgi:hypothetical protein
VGPTPCEGRVCNGCVGGVFVTPSVRKTSNSISTLNVHQVSIKK